jgi:hypothetical protein
MQRRRAWPVGAEKDSSPRTPAVVTVSTRSGPKFLDLHRYYVTTPAQRRTARRPSRPNLVAQHEGQRGGARSGARFPSWG